MKFHHHSNPFEAMGKGIKKGVSSVTKPITKPIGKTFSSIGKGIKDTGSELLNDAKGITKGIKDFGDRLTDPTTIIMVAGIVVGGVVLVHLLKNKK